MIVTEPPYDLVAFFADLDAMTLVQRLIERGQERRCLRSLRWRSVRDASRDQVHRNADTLVRPFSRDAACRFVILWDREGSGAEDDPDETPAAIFERLDRIGISRDRVFAEAFDPEVEAVLTPVWSRAKAILAEERSALPPDDAAVLSEASRIVEDLPMDLETALRRFA